MAKIFGIHAKIAEYDSQSYALTIGAVTSAPTPGTGAISTAIWRRVGDCMEISYTFSQTNAGSAGSGIYLFPLPAGYAIDTTKALISTSGSGTSGTIVGSAYIANNTTVNTSTQDPGFVIPYNSTNVAVYYQNGSTTIVAMGGPAAIGLSSTPIYLTFNVKVPIVGWKGSDIVPVSP